jgi:hypothetical protein
MHCPLVFLFVHFSIRCCNQRRNEFFLPGKIPVTKIEITPTVTSQILHFSRVWRPCKTSTYHTYVTFLARPGSSLATLVLREMQDHNMYIGMYCQYVEKRGLGPVRSGGNPKGLLYRLYVQPHHLPKRFLLFVKGFLSVVLLF